MTIIETLHTPIHVPAKSNKLLQKVADMINEHEEIKTLWEVSNVNATYRLNMPDHGPVHFQIVANIAIKMCRLLVKDGIEMSITKDFGLSNDHAELVIFLTSLFHDLGISIHREGHEGFSLFIANNLLREILTFLPIKERTIVTSEVLHAIISHRTGGKPLTIEAGIVRVADALDMSKGRSKTPFESGVLDIHSVSAAGIESVDIDKGDKKPIQITILMSNSAGLFQVDELLKNKLMKSGIEKFVDVKAYISRKTEKKLLKEFYIGDK
jgi:uncharacterized protein